MTEEVDYAKCLEVALDAAEAAGAEIRDAWHLSLIHI